MDLIYKHETSLFRIAVVLSAIFWVLLVVGTLGIALIYILLFYVIFLFVHSGFISYIKGNGVKITEAQYPDLHKRVISCCQKVGLTEIPDAYLLRTDFFNALATRFLGRNFIVLFTDVLDALEDQPGISTGNIFFGVHFSFRQACYPYWVQPTGGRKNIPVIGMGLFVVIATKM